MYVFMFVYTVLLCCGPMCNALPTMISQTSFCLFIVSTVPSHLQMPPTVPSAAEPVASQLPNSDALAAVAQLFQSPHGQEASQ